MVISYRRRAVRQPYKTIGLAAVGLSLIAAPVLAFSSKSFQDKASNYVAQNCNDTANGGIALSCFLYAKAQEYGASLSRHGASLTRIDKRVLDVEKNKLPSLSTENATQNASIDSIQTGLKDASTMVNDLKSADGSQNETLDDLSTRLTALQDDVSKLGSSAPAVSGSPKVYASAGGGPLIGTLVSGQDGGDFQIFVPSKKVFVTLNYQTGQHRRFSYFFFLLPDCAGDRYMSPQLDYYAYGTVNATQLYVPTDETPQELLPKSMRFPDGNCSNQPGNDSRPLLKATPVNLPFPLPAGKLILAP
jgi:hypothetical protein